MPEKKTIGRPFEKGNCANPLGAKAHDAALRTVRKLTKLELSEMGTLILDGNLDDLKKVTEDKKSSVLKVWIATVAMKAISKGDMHSLNQLLDRIVGKVREHVEHSGPDGGLIPIGLTKLSDEELQLRYEAVKKRILEEEKNG